MVHGDGRSVVLDVSPLRLATQWNPEEDPSNATVHVTDRPDLVALDLTDATGRIHAAWWAMERDRTLAFTLLALSRPDMHRRPSMRRSVWGTLQAFCAYLSDLDPSDPRTLEDGSRRVDAEALRLVCLYVAGLEVTT